MPERALYIRSPLDHPHISASVKHDQRGKYEHDSKKNGGACICRMWINRIVKRKCHGCQQLPVENQKCHGKNVEIAYSSNHQCNGDKPCKVRKCYVEKSSESSSPIHHCLAVEI